MLPPPRPSERAIRAPTQRAQRRVKQREVGRQALEGLSQEENVLVAEAHLVLPLCEKVEGGGKLLGADR